MSLSTEERPEWPIDRLRLLEQVGWLQSVLHALANDDSSLTALEWWAVYCGQFGTPRDDH